MNEEKLKAVELKIKESVYLFKEYVNRQKEIMQELIKTYQELMESEKSESIKKHE